MAEIVGGGTPSTKQSKFWDGDIPWLTPKDLSSFSGVYVDKGSRSITHDGLRASSAKMLPPGSVLYTSRAPIGYVAIASTPIATNQGFKSFVLKEGFVPEYVFYLLKASKAEIESHASGGTFAEISAKAIANVLLPFPPLEHQRAIANILSSLDMKLEINKSISKSLEGIAQALFKSWFIDFDPVKAKMSGQNPVGMDDETASLFPDSLVESELGMIPASWDVFPASELFEIGIGRTPPRKEPEWFSKDKIGVPWVSIRDMGNFGVFSSLTTECLSEAAVLKFRVPIVPPQTVLMSFKLTVGKLCITDRPLVTNEAIAHFRVPTDGRLDSNYAYLWLSKHDMRTLDSTSSIGTATNSGVIRNIKFLVPSEGVLVKFQKTIEPIFKNLQLLQEQSATLAELRESLLARLVSGELQIPEEMLAS